MVGLVQRDFRFDRLGLGRLGTPAGRAPRDAAGGRLGWPGSGGPDEGADDAELADEGGTERA